MSITSFSGLLTQVTRLIDGDDVSVSSIAVATLEQVIAQAEKRIYREVRSRHNEKAFSAVTVSGNLATLPADFEACSTVHFGGKALTPMPEDWIRGYIDNGATGDCLYFAEAGPALYFGPAVANSTAVQGRYFCRLPDLNSTTLPTNALIAAEPDLFIYAILVEAAPFFSKDAGYWEAKYSSIRDRINSDKTRAAYSAGRIRVRPSTSLMG